MPARSIPPSGSSTSVAGSSSRKEGGGDHRRRAGPIPSQSTDHSPGDLVVATEIATVILEFKDSRQAGEGQINGCKWASPDTGATHPYAYSQRHAPTFRRRTPCTVRLGATLAGLHPAIQKGEPIRIGGAPIGMPARNG